MNRTPEVRGGGAWLRRSCPSFPIRTRCANSDLRPGGGEHAGLVENGFRSRHSIDDGRLSKEYHIQVAWQRARRPGWSPQRSTQINLQLVVLCRPPFGGRPSMYFPKRSLICVSCSSMNSLQSSSAGLFPGFGVRGSHFLRGREVLFSIQSVIMILDGRGRPR